MSKNIISVLIVVNNIDELSVTIGSLLKQEERDWEAILLLEKNFDKEIPFIKEIINKIKLIKLKENTLTINKKIDISLRKTKGDYILWLKSGDTLSSNYFREILELMDAQPDKVLSYSSYYIKEKNMVIGEKILKNLTKYDFFIDSLNNSFLFWRTMLFKKSVLSSKTIQSLILKEDVDNGDMSKLLFLNILMNFSTIGIHKKFFKLTCSEKPLLKINSLDKSLLNILFNQGTINDIFIKFEIPEIDRLQFGLNLVEILDTDAYSKLKISGWGDIKINNFVSIFDIHICLKNVINEYFINYQNIKHKNAMAIIEKVYQYIENYGLTNTEIIKNWLLLVLNTAKIEINNDNMGYAIVLLEDIVNGPFVTYTGINQSAIYYLAKCQMELKDFTEAKNLIIKLLEISPYHIAGKKLIIEIKKYEDK